MMQRLRGASFLLGVLVVFLGATACGSAPAAVGSKIQVVAAENFYGDLLSQVCGDTCAVTSIISNPNTDPHAYEANVNNAKAVANASLVIVNGVGYDAFMQQLLNASPNPSRRVITVQTVMGVANGGNPHLWYNPVTMPKLARLVAQDLGKIDPAKKATFTARANAFISSLAPLNAKIAAIKAAYPQAKVAYTEPVFGYMGAALGLYVLTPEPFQLAVEQGVDPPAAALATEESLLNHHQVAVLIYNLQTVEPVTTQIQALARQDGIPIVGVSETEPLHEDYQTWMMNQLTKLETALAHGG